MDIAEMSSLPLIRLAALLRPHAEQTAAIEHDLDVICHADWIVDVGPAAGEHGGCVLYSGPPGGLAAVVAALHQRAAAREEQR